MEKSEHSEEETPTLPGIIEYGTNHSPSSSDDYPTTFKKSTTKIEEGIVVKSKYRFTPSFSSLGSLIFGIILTFFCIVMIAGEFGEAQYMHWYFNTLSFIIGVFIPQPTLFKQKKNK